MSSIPSNVLRAAANDLNSSMGRVIRFTLRGSYSRDDYTRGMWPEKTRVQVG
jgi:hypothetical protein